jgi:hypothetical protein
LSNTNIGLNENTGINMTTEAYDRLNAGPADEIDAAVWSSDMFLNRENIADFRSLMARWELGLQEAESILEEMEKSNAQTR